MEMAAIASTAFQFVGAIAGGEAQASAMNQQADQAMAGARNARLSGGAREEMVRRHNADRLAAQRAAFAQSGFDPNGGSMVKLQAESAGHAELDALTERYQAELQSIGMMNQASSLRAGATTARRQGYLNAAGSLAQSSANFFGGARIGPPAPVETAIPVPVGNILGR